jgi:tetratricopeptide (TPR) repeat protein
MYAKGWGVIVIALMFIAVLTSGCVANTSEKQTSLTPTTQTPSAKAADLREKAFDAYINRNYSTALDFYNQSLSADPTYIIAWIGKGDVLVRMNRTSEAISAYDSALAINGEVPEFWNKRGEALMTLGRYTEARDSFDKALKIAPEYAQAKENRNLTLAKLK